MKRVLIVFLSVTFCSGTPKWGSSAKHHKVFIKSERFFFFFAVKKINMCKRINTSIASLVLPFNVCSYFRSKIHNNNKGFDSLDACNFLYWLERLKTKVWKEKADELPNCSLWRIWVDVGEKRKHSNEVIFVQSFSNQKETLIDGNHLSLNLEPKAFQVNFFFFFEEFTYLIWIYFNLKKKP